MSALTISAVNSGTDELTITAHGLNTGDGIFAIYTPNGAIPGGLAPVTDYWFIKTGTDTGKLASSSANAFAGTPINITSSGSGTLLLLRGLPFRRPRNAVPGQQVFSGDLNAAWDAQTAGWALLTGQAQSVIDSAAMPEIIGRRPLPVDYVTGGGWTAQILANGSSVVVGTDIVSGAGVSQIVVPFGISSFQKLRRVTVEVYGNGADNIIGQVSPLADGATSASASPTPAGTTTLVAPAAAWQRMTIACADAVLDGTHEFVFLMQANGAAIRARHLRVVCIPG